MKNVLFKIANKTRRARLLSKSLFSHDSQTQKLERKKMPLGQPAIKVISFGGKKKSNISLDPPSKRLWSSPIGNCIFSNVIEDFSFECHYPTKVEMPNILDLHRSMPSKTHFFTSRGVYMITSHRVFILILVDLNVSKSKSVFEEHSGEK